MDCFGAVTTNRTQLTDTDGDGMSDYTEFVAGTNPTNAATWFCFTQTTLTNHLVELEWNVATNRLYQVNISTSLKSWSPVTVWLQASDRPTMNFTATYSGNASRFFRVQVLR